MTSARARYRTIARYFFLGLGIALAALVVPVGFIVVGNDREAELRDQLERYHLRVAALSTRIAVEISDIHHGSHRGYDHLTAIEAAASAHNLASARRSFARIETAEESLGIGKMVAPLQRVKHRLERFARVFASIEQGAPFSHESFDAEIASLMLAIEQLRRLHELEANQAIARLEEMDARQATSLLLIGAGVAAVIALAAARLLTLLRRSFLEEEEARASLARSRQQLLHSQKIEALGRLAGGIAHDFNNILTAVMGHAETLKRSLAPTDPLREEALGVERGAEQAASLTKQLLTFSQQETEQERTIDLNRTVERMTLMLQRLVGDDVRIQYRLAPDLGCIRVDPGKIEQVILNLVVNARDAMPNGGTITIETANTGAVDHQDPGLETGHFDYVRMTVADTGEGIETAAQSLIFEPFFTTKAPDEGTGLGLSIVDGIVRGAGGFVSIDSRTGGGTAFHVHLPIVDAPAGIDTPDVIPHPGVATSAATILLAEDQPSVRKLCGKALRAAGYSVLEASDGVEALKLCRQQVDPIALIVTDVRMPNMSGPELVERAKQTHPEARVLFISGYAGDMGERPPGQLLAKPFRGDELLDRVRRVLSAEAVSAP